MWRPEFLREITDRTEAIGIVDATREILARNNITVDTQGDIEAIANHSGGLLFVGNHSQQWEFVGLMDVMSKLGRQDVLHVGKFYIQRRTRQVLGHAAAAAVLPVYPRSLANDRRQKLNHETLNRIVYRRSLLSSEESAAANDRAVRAASDHLVQGGVVNIYPCGGVVDWSDRPWRQGVGRVIASIPDAYKEKTAVVPYTSSVISTGRLIMAVVAQGRGYAGRPQSFTMQFGMMRSAAELVAELPAGERDNPKSITESLRQWSLRTV